MSKHFFLNSLLGHFFLVPVRNYGHLRQDGPAPIDLCSSIFFRTKVKIFMDQLLLIFQGLLNLQEDQLLVGHVLEMRWRPFHLISADLCAGISLSCSKIYLFRE